MEQKYFPILRTLHFSDPISIPGRMFSLSGTQLLPRSTKRKITTQLTTKICEEEDVKKTDNPSKMKMEQKYFPILRTLHFSDPISIPGRMFSLSGTQLLPRSTKRKITTQLTSLDIPLKKARCTSTTKIYEEDVQKKTDNPPKMKMEEKYFLILRTLPFSDPISIPERMFSLSGTQLLPRSTKRKITTQLTSLDVLV
ncbi:hypothetical protein CEXT_688681 [Caerostris extrusa]|uniref:HAT C-terminal dimerisation domain-containing protein n=1 Tax=Caerostris extrusa TaxID=172846 RepID=A0AAV4N923_CAEEX|nr:hypothetical protein CEXT_688681 [Caerostris extrusa]